MKIVYKKLPMGASTVKVRSIARILYDRNLDAYIFDKVDPFDCMERLMFYGIKASAVPLVRDRKLVGFKFSHIDRKRLRPKLSG